MVWISLKPNWYHVITFLDNVSLRFFSCCLWCSGVIRQEHAMVSGISGVFCMSKWCTVYSDTYSLILILPQKTFTEVAQWLAHHPKEIIILACSTFDGLIPKDHQKFIAQLTQLFPKKLCPKMVHTVHPTYHSSVLVICILCELLWFCSRTLQVHFIFVEEQIVLWGHPTCGVSWIEWSQCWCFSHFFACSSRSPPLFNTAGIINIKWSFPMTIQKLPGTRSCGQRLTTGGVCITEHLQVRL